MKMNRDEVCRKFMAECLEELPGALSTAGDIHVALCRWCDKKGWIPVSKKYLGIFLAGAELTSSKTTNGLRVWEGVVIKHHPSAKECRTHGD
jgi:hypothetical protein